jgi:hypothetical protein
MTLTKIEFGEHLRGFRHRELFNYLGWDNDRTALNPIMIAETIYEPKIIADKNGFKIISCASKDMPTYAARVQIANALKKLFHESIIIFSDRKKSEQVWLYSYNENGRNKKAEVKYSHAQDPERLYERAAGLIFDIDEQDNITIIDVTARVRSNFAVNAERVTKRFYDAFKKEHTALLRLISGIESEVDRDWYASIMLNRLMFCYFMQRRGFLNHDRDYLRTKLNESKQKLGKGKFYSFYRNFLLELFQKGFGTYAHSPEVVAMIGDIPYLNGGLFDLHEIERNYPKIDISDEAFARIFDLFDRYEWHLDTRDCATGNEISPDVLGYIFEKYINDRASMGAYYTQEDITDYISRNTILPFLLESVKKTCAKSFAKDGVVWKFLQDSADSYIFDSVKHGADKSLPDNIASGLDTTKPDLLVRRKDWNTTAPSDYALPTEIWREVIDRRTRYESTLGKIKSGEITDIADFITYNLDIVGFVGDLLDTIEDPQFVQAFYIALEKITILDPTCGSGAFLFAALNILEPLYDRCLSRMEDYLSHDYKGSLERGVRRYFDEKMEMMEDEIHPNKHYFVYKSIILNNLYGVDIMREAVETAKLRLFLKLVSTATPDYRQKNIGIEPLPDIDFNIKAGNTLIGYANEKEVDASLHDAAMIDAMCFSGSLKGDVKDAMFNLAKATARYKQLQLGQGDYSGGEFKDAKNDLAKRQAYLKQILDKALKVSDYRNISDEDWANYMPFHWVAEFYTIIVENNGFDVIIGNPPYVEYSAAKQTYKLKAYDTLICGNLYAFVMERNNHLLKALSISGMIIPHSAFCTDRMRPIVKLFKKTSLWVSTYDIRPSKLFYGVDQRLAIYISKTGLAGAKYTTKYNRWNDELRLSLFKTLSFAVNKVLIEDVISKNQSRLFDGIISKIKAKSKKISKINAGNNRIYFHNAPRYWIRATNFKPYFKNDRSGEALSTQVKTLAFDSISLSNYFLALLNSSLFYIWFITISDSRHLNMREIINFPEPESFLEGNIFESLVNELMNNYKINKRRKNTHYASTGDVVYDEYYPKKSKFIIDLIDRLLAHHYGFTEEELDYIINYDIKYRMGISGSVGDDDDND